MCVPYSAEGIGEWACRILGISKLIFWQNLIWSTIVEFSMSYALWTMVNGRSMLSILRVSFLSITVLSAQWMVVGVRLVNGALVTQGNVWGFCDIPRRFNPYSTIS